MKQKSLSTEQQKLIVKSLIEYTCSQMGFEQTSIKQKNISWEETNLKEYKIIPRKPHSFYLGKTKKGNDKYLVLDGYTNITTGRHLTGIAVYYEAVIYNSNQYSAYKMHECKVEGLYSFENGGVYLLKVDYKDKSLLKIGQAENVFTRFIMHKSSNPELEFLGHLNLGNFKQVEKEILKRFEDLQYDGEWFHFDQNIIDWFMNQVTWKSS